MSTATAIAATIAVWTITAAVTAPIIGHTIRTMAHRQTLNTPPHPHRQWWCTHCQQWHQPPHQ